MHSYRVLGVIALCAVVIAVIGFTAADITIDSANGCLAARSACSGDAVPARAIAYAVLGVVALVAAIPPGVAWVIGMLRRPVPAESAVPLFARRVPRPLLTDEDL